MHGMKTRDLIFARLQGLALGFRIIGATLCLVTLPFGVLCLIEDFSLEFLVFSCFFAALYGLSYLFEAVVLIDRRLSDIEFRLTRAEERSKERLPVTHPERQSN